MGEGEVGAEVMNNGLETNVSSRIGLKRDHQGDLEEAESGVFSNKKQAKEASNDDLRSEVSNPNSFSPRETFSSFPPINSDPAEQPGSSHIVCGDLSSTCSGNSGTGNLESLESSGEEDHSRNNTTGATSISHVILEIPKYATSTGVRKVTFKFRKSKEDCEDNLTSSISTLSETAVSNWPAHVKVDEDHQRDPLSITRSTTVHPTKSGKYSNKPAIDMELQMPKKVAADIFPTNVKKFLSTGILEGARVKYISPSEEKILHGIICGCGYLCGCSACSFLKVVTAYEFEVHAGGKTRHPNNHIYLENGMPIYSIIQKLRTVPLSILDEVVKDLAGSAVNEERFQVWKDRFQQNKGMVEVHTSASHLHPRSPSWHIEDTTHTISTSRVQSFFEQHVHMKEKSEDRKRRVKKKKKFILDADIQHKRTAEGVTRKRDNDLHRLLFMPNGLPDGADLGYYIKGQRILRGYKQGNGIVCSCCDREISPSQFEAHAGWAARRQPYRHIYISNGLTLHDIAISLANGQKLTTGDSDDMCALCGDGGDMIFCGGCPRAFHAACLGQERATEGNWHCPHCKDKSGPGIKAPTADSSGTGKPIVVRLTQLVKVPEYQSGGCVFCRNYNFSSDKFDNQTVLLCDQCEREFHVGCLRERGFCDLKELPKEKWFCCEDCSMIHSGLQNLVSTGVDAIPASLANALKWNHIESRCADVSLNDVQWQILSGKSRIPEHLPVLSRATAIFRECFTPIIAKSGRDLIPVMVYGRNISGQEFGGMYCIVLIVKSVVVSAGLLRIFGREVAELPLVATSQEYQRKGYFQALFSCIEGLLSSLNVENLVLPSAEDAELLWTKKLGFQKMSEEQLLKYTKEIQLTMFKGTSMLQKVVPRRRSAA